MDGKNTVYMTSDDRYFIGKPTTAAYMNVWYGTDSVYPKDGKYTFQRKIKEADGKDTTKRGGSQHSAASQGLLESISIKMAD